MSESREQAPASTPAEPVNGFEGLPSFVKVGEEAKGDGSIEYELHLKKDSRFTEERMEAIQGPIEAGWLSPDENKANPITLTDYLGSYSLDGEEAMQSDEAYKRSGHKKHLWQYSAEDGERNIAALDEVVFPEDRREKLEQAGVHLNRAGMLEDIDPVPEPTQQAAEEEETKPELKETPLDGLPESVTNSYNVYERPSGLLVVESKGYHRSKTHKSDEVTSIPIPGLTGPIPEKQRGIAYREKPLDADPTKSIIVAERPDSTPPKNKPSDSRQPKIYDWEAEDAFGEPPQEPPEDNGEVEEEGEPEPKPQPQTQPAPQMPPPEEPPKPPDSPERKTSPLELSVGFAEKAHRGEDSMLVNKELELFGVFDGMGGMENGAEASRTAANTIEEVYRNTPRPRTREEALTQIKHAMAVARQRVSEVNGFTTAVFGIAEEIQGKLYFVWGNAGDSRLLLERNGSHESVRSISKEHVMPDGRSVYNALTPKKIKKGKEKTYIPYTEPTLTDDDEFGIIELSDGDRIVLCSDGITGDRGWQILTEKELQDAFNLEYAQQAADELIRISRKRDDKSVIVIDALKAEQT